MSWHKTIVDCINCFLNKKSKTEIMYELESYKQKSCWDNSSKVSEDILREYSKEIGAARCCNVQQLTALCQQIIPCINSDNSIDVLEDLLNLLNKIILPSDEEKLYSIEIMHLFLYKKLKRNLEQKIKELKNTKQ